MKDKSLIDELLKKMADAERRRRIELALTQWDRARAVRHLVSDANFGRLNMGRN